MRGNGITYDTGFVRNGRTSRPEFEPETVRRELEIIRNDLRCTAVQVVGGDPERLELAARYAAELGLEVWFSPYPLELTDTEIVALFADCARRAEQLRQTGAEIVFVTGVELSLMNREFLPGDSVWERLEFLLDDPDTRGERLGQLIGRLDRFLAAAVEVVREHFRGKLTYCAIPFEQIDWSPFDIVSIELIRSAEVADRFRAGVRELVAQGKPLAVTGFGAATWRGAADVAPRSNEIVEYDAAGDPVRLNGHYDRDEDGQAAYLTELLEIFDSEGVDSAFVFLFALHSHPHRPDGDPRDDLDLASLGIVKVLENRRGTTYPDMAWEPKASFTAVADFYRERPAKR
ncbi:hypothetical protein [Nocardia stercoris]|uniref:Abortive infection protein n=1 Tax=Nocardia stercoris TaxID=2483361 RepID=A0A3M2L100_9NOCA|nr:hypothetical protein [Nocardia stercoris]RMI31409.1 hypothetical protein EBN03_18840 [Nocardia stercoris]